MEGINLGSLLESIRGELEAVDRNRQALSRAALFELESFDLEVKFVVTKQETSSGGLNFQVLRFDGGDSVHSEAVQTIRLSYKVSRHRPPGSRLHSSSEEGAASTEIDLLGESPQ